MLLPPYGNLVDLGGCMEPWRGGGRERADELENGNPRGSPYTGVNDDGGGLGAPPALKEGLRRSPGRTFGTMGRSSYDGPGMFVEGVPPPVAEEEPWDPALVGRPTRWSTFSLCNRFFKWTSKLPTVISGPGV